jgi:integrase
MEPQRFPKTKVKTEHGTVIVYTPRHVGDCQLRDRNANLCSCPKWIYSKPKDGKPTQRAAGTPSFTEAVAKAQELLDSFNPKVAAALAITQPKAGITIEDALALYEAALKRRTVTPKHVIACLQPFRRRAQKEYRPRKEHGRARNLSLLDWLDRENRAARAPVVRMVQITSNHLDQWSAGWQSNDSSSHLWRGKVAQFLKWARVNEHIEVQPEFREPLRVRSGNRCGHFENSQIEKMYAAVPFYKMANHPMPENFAARMIAFLDCGRYAGMAIVDIVHFQPQVNLGKNNVLVYRRHKNGQIASVLLDPKIAARLRAIPAETGSDPERPFRYLGTDLESNKQTWRDRFQKLCSSVGISEIETEIGKKRVPNVHMLRDTFAISAIVNGVSLDNVAKMLGHATTAMTQRSYLFWVKSRLDHCIEDQRKALDRQAAAAQDAQPEREAEPALVN